MPDPRRLPASCLLAVLLAGCASTPSGPPVPAERADAPHYACPDGRRFTTQFDPTTQQTDLRLAGPGAGGGLHRLGPVPDPNGGVLYQDADFQLRPGASPDHAALTDRSTLLRQDCTRG